MTDDQERWLASVVRVGDGRGFVIEADYRRSLVITAAHCLPHLPPPHGAAYLEEKTYAKILGPLDEEPTVWAECLFVDPVADLAVLGEPDGQELFDQSECYEALVEERALPIATVPLVRPPIVLPDGTTIAGRPEWRGRAWLLSLEGRWFGCDIRATFLSLWLENAAEPIRSGMSGSPIVSLDGAAIGVVCLSEASPTVGGPNPFLWQQLPRWVTGE
jgi:hypothetical protein